MRLAIQLVLSANQIAHCHIQGREFMMGCAGSGVLDNFSV